MVVIKLNAGNDVNGNPRRVFVVLDGEGIVKAIDEGYAGTANLEKHFPGLKGCNVDTFETTPKEYRTLLREFGK